MKAAESEIQEPISAIIARRPVLYCAVLLAFLLQLELRVFLRKKRHDCRMAALKLRHGCRMIRLQMVHFIRMTALRLNSFLHHPEHALLKRRELLQHRSVFDLGRKGFDVGEDALDVRVEAHAPDAGNHESANQAGKSKPAA